MTTDPDCPPPPYTPSDPLTPATTQAPGSPLRLRGGDGQIPAYSPRTTAGVADEGSPTSDAASQAPGFSSARAYFEQRGLRINPHDDTTLHQLFVSPADRAEDIARIPLCWRNRTSDLTQADMSTFANFLLPPDANTRLPPKLRADLASDEKDAISPTDIESDAERRARMSLVVSEWNEAFFYPRGLQVEIVFVPRHPPYAARGLDPICQSCVAANNSASRYAAQAPYQEMPPSMPYGIGMLPPRPPMAHGPEAFPYGVPPHAPYGRMPFGFGYFRDGIERLANGRGRSRGRGRDDYFAGRAGFHSNNHRHRHLHHGRRPRSSSRSSSSSSSSSESDSGRHHSSRHTRRDRGPGRGRGCAEACGRRRERHRRRRGRSSSTSSSSSSGSESSIDWVSTRDVQGLGLQAIISGIAAAKLGKEGEKFGLKMEQMAQKFGANMENVGNKIDAKLAIKELKEGLKEMKRENPTGWKKELKGFKKDFKQQMKEVKRERKGARERRKNRGGRGRGMNGSKDGAEKEEPEVEKILMGDNGMEMESQGRIPGNKLPVSRRPTIRIGSSQGRQ